ncbi:MAG: hypothetical protein H6999_00300 [Hahellaceae bacterium]|nr:hypothetical protein [Hahellaceae bacterium]MCP5168191.1 hypothetical protein [Hahellaceae bacterium]
MPTVNEDFKRELRRAFISGFEEALIASSGWDVKEKSSTQMPEHEEFFMLTISSQLFRVVVVLHFTKNTELEQFVVNSIKQPNKVLEEDKFYDFVGEVGNAFCGAIKREIGRTVPTLGMSTPNRLGHDCLQYVSGQKFEFDAHAEALFQSRALMFASVYLCADQNLNFEVKQSSATENDVDSGELEFF